MQPDADAVLLLVPGLPSPEMFMRQRSQTAQMQSEPSSERNWWTWPQKKMQERCVCSAFLFLMWRS